MDFIRLRRRASVAAVLALAMGCSPKQEPAPPPPAESAPPPAPPPAPPVLGRADLLEAVAQAASAAALGAPAPEGATALAGRRFALRLPFGCFGPTADANAGYAYDAEKQTLKVTVKPESWTDAGWARALVGTPQTEAIEGFWIRRPWIRSEACPAAPAAPPAGAAPPEAPSAKVDRSPTPAPPPARPATPERIGIARVFEAGGSRLPRRGGRAYEVTEKAPQEPTPGRGGFRLLIEGRIAQPEAGGPVRCRVVSPEQPPVCLILADIDRVAVEAADGRQLAEWGS
jgi:hypothetical protein